MTQTTQTALVIVETRGVQQRYTLPYPGGFIRLVLDARRDHNKRILRYEIIEGERKWN